MMPTRILGEETWVRERVAFLIMVAILIFLFAFTFAILGKGSYQPSGEENASAPAFLVSA
jgi:succinate dehydrogenase hydrophobic anchor subunit